VASSPKSAPAIVRTATARVVAIEDFVNWIGKFAAREAPGAIGLF